jgi:tight adherence protein B
MSFELDPIYLVYLLVAVSAGLFVEGVYLLLFSGTSYRKNVNRRLKLLKNEPNRENILVQLRKERGLTGAGSYSIGFEALNRLVLQSGLTIGINKLLIFIAVAVVASFAVAVVVRGSAVEALLIALFCGIALPYLVLRMLRGRRQKAFGAQFPDGLDMIVRSLRAGHPVPIAITMVAREMRTRSAASSASSPTRSPMAPTSRPPCATSISASARTICRCSSPRWRSRARPAAISARSSRTSRA